MANMGQENQNKMLIKFEEHFYKTNKLEIASHIDALTPVEYFKNIPPYQKRGIQFLLNNFAEKKGCILDQEKEMNVFIEIVTFFKCVTNSESLFGVIVSSEEQILHWNDWFNKLSKLSVNVLNDKEDIRKGNWSKCNIILVNFKLIPFLPIKICKVLVLDSADEIINTALRSFSQNMTCEMRVALTNARIRRVSQRKILWELLKFTNPHQMQNSTLKSFLSNCMCNIENLLWFQWNDIYLRLDWKSYKKCKESLNAYDQDTCIIYQSNTESNFSNSSSELNTNRKSKKSEFAKFTKNRTNNSKFKDGSSYFRYCENEFYTPNSYYLQQRNLLQET